VTGSRRLLPAVLVLVAAFLVAPAAASATALYASPSGPGSAPCDDQSSPCPIGTAVGLAGSGDDVTLLGGVPPATAFTAADTLTIPAGATVHGAPGARPVVNFTTDPGNDGFFLNGPGSALRDVVAITTAQSSTPMVALGGTVERVTAHASGGSDANYACVTGEGAAIRDSVCWFSGSSDPNNGAVGAFAQVSLPTGPVTLRNVTAIAPNSIGLQAISVGAYSIAVTAINSVIRGGTTDVKTAVSTSGAGTHTVSLNYSNYATRTETTAGDITDPATGANQTASPVFANAATGDFHETSASLGTLDLGTATGVLVGELDPDGAPRILGSAPDIGAYESALPVVGGTTTPVPTTAMPKKKKCKKKKHRAAAAKKCKKKKR
jgi:hypothetical protein